MLEQIIADYGFSPIKVEPGNKLHGKQTYLLGQCITEVYDKSALTPMNKFVCKLHGYMVYFYMKFQRFQDFDNLAVTYFFLF